MHEGAANGGAPAPRTIIRPDARGDPDDVVIEDVTCVRMERMDASAWWIAVYRGDQRVAFWLQSHQAIRIGIIEDELGCVDDTLLTQKECV